MRRKLVWLELPLCEATGALLTQSHLRAKTTFLISQQKCTDMHDRIFFLQKINSYALNVRF